MEGISQRQARRIAVAASFKDFGKGKAATLGNIRHLGYVQIDTISVIERAHHHILRSRQPDYIPDFLNHLLSVDRSVFEYWAHAVAYLPIEDHRFFVSKHGSYKNPTSKWQKEKYRIAQPILKPILERIRKEGPLASKDFENSKQTSPAGWWDWKPAKVALEILYLQGELMVAERRKFQRLYDLTDRVLPRGIDKTKASSEDCAGYQIDRALTAMGLARESEISKHIPVCDRKTLKVVLADRIASGELMKVQVHELPGEEYYARPGSLLVPSSRKAVRILSPFDNLVIQRERMRLLFNFNYTIECYVPAPKRKYGYFVCPVLWGDEFVARIDMKADRKSGILQVNSLHLESDFKENARFKKELDKALKEFATFNGCTYAPG